MENVISMVPENTMKWLHLHVKHNPHKIPFSAVSETLGEVETGGWGSSCLLLLHFKMLLPQTYNFEWVKPSSIHRIFNYHPLYLFLYMLLEKKW